jgi:hypothetical protein
MKKCFLIAFLLGLAGCGERMDNATETAATNSAENWIKFIDDAKYDESWDNAAEAFKIALSKDKWRDAVQPVRLPLGKLLSRHVKSKEFTKTLPGAPDGPYVVIQYESTFEHKQSAVETIVPMLEKDGKWRVSGYFIK